MYGGPYAFETDAIRDERIRASELGVEPDFDKLFEGVDLSDGAKQVIEDIKNPPEPVVGPFVNNVEGISDKEENTAEVAKEESEPESDKGGTKEVARDETSTERSLEEILEGVGDNDSE